MNDDNDDDDDDDDDADDDDEGDSAADLSISLRRVSGDTYEVSSTGSSANGGSTFRCA